MPNELQDVKALILSGGGVKGTFQYGAIEHILAHNLQDGERFKIVCGVSAGALNGVIVAQDKFLIGKDIWMDQIATGVPAFRMRHSPLKLALYGILPGILIYNKMKKTDSLFINDGLRSILEQVCEGLVDNLRATETFLRLGIVDYQTGGYVSADPIHPFFRGREVEFITASTAIPLAFPPMSIKERQYFDGGVVNMTPFADIFDIVRMPQFHSRYRLKEIYSVLCSPLGMEESHQLYRGLIDIGARTLDILAKEIYRNDLDMFNRTNALVWFRREVARLIGEEEMDVIFEKLLQETGMDIRKYETAACRTVAPDPLRWKDFLESDLYPSEAGNPDRNGDSIELFYRQWPSTLCRDPVRLLACYHFGLYMAREVLGT